MISVNHATKAKQNLDVVNETIGANLLFWFLLIHFLKCKLVVVYIEKRILLLVEFVYAYFEYVNFVISIWTYFVW